MSNWKLNRVSNEFKMKCMHIHYPTVPQKVVENVNLLFLRIKLKTLLQSFCVKTFSGTHSVTIAKMSRRSVTPST